MMLWMTRLSLFDTASDLATPQLLQASLDAEALFYELVYGEPNEERGPAPAPLRFMWRGYETAVAAYSVALAAEAVRRGITDGVRSLHLAQTVRDMRRSGDDMPFEMPPHLRIPVLQSHRSNLKRRWPQYYAKLFKASPELLPYIWCNEDGLRLSKYDRELVARGERKLPEGEMKELFHD